MKGEVRSCKEMCLDVFKCVAWISEDKNVWLATGENGITLLLGLDVAC